MRSTYADTADVARSVSTGIQFFEAYLTNQVQISSTTYQAVLPLSVTVSKPGVLVINAMFTGTQYNSSGTGWWGIGSDPFSVIPESEFSLSFYGNEMATSQVKVIINSAGSYNFYLNAKVNSSSYYLDIYKASIIAVFYPQE